MPNASQYQLVDHIALTDVDDEIVLLDLNNGSYYGLNSVGAQFIKGLQNKLSTPEAVNEIATHFQMDNTQVSADIDELIEQLLAQELIEAAD